MVDQSTLGKIAHTAVIAALISIVCFVALLTLGARAEKVRVKVPLVMS
jgi:hypothetical protein